MDRPTAASCYCGDLSWTTTDRAQYGGRVTHKHGCPARTDSWCQTHPQGCPEPTAASRPQQFIKRLDSRYCVPKDMEVVRILAAWKVANEDGGTGWHYEYDVLYEEVLS